MLKTIRKQVADANGIKYEPRECHHQGECRGTCPACEAEVRYIERQLDIRRQLGKAVMVMGISAGLSALTSCSTMHDEMSPIDPRLQTLTEEKAETGSAFMPVGYVERRDIFGDVDVVEQMPSFPGGQQKLMEYLEANTHYPKEAEDRCVHGRVVISFIVEKDGSITDLEVIRSVDPLLDAEALRVAKSMPKWIPGKQNGEAIRVKYTIPITFKLNK